jgi:hypothetical protein
MPKSTNNILVLWIDNCDEVAAAIFTAELRQAGLRVRVISLTRQQTRGARGLALLPDLTLERALHLANYTSCLIIPCPLRVIQGLKDHPRLREFFSLLRSNQAKFVLGPLNGGDVDDLELFSLSREDVTVYPESEDLVKFAREFAGSLSIVI